MKVVIDGVEYVPVTRSNPSAEQIARGIMESFWGSDLPDGYTWESEAKSLFVDCTDSPQRGVETRVIDVVACILNRLEA